MDKKGTHTNVTIYEHAASLKVQIIVQVADAIRATSLTISKLRKEDPDAYVNGTNVLTDEAIPRSQKNLTTCFNLK